MGALKQKFFERQEKVFDACVVAGIYADDPEVYLERFEPAYYNAMDYLHETRRLSSDLFYTDEDIKKMVNIIKIIEMLNGSQMPIKEVM